VRAADTERMNDDVLDAARDAVLDLAVDHLLDSVHDRITGDLRDWLAGYVEVRQLTRHLLRVADALTADDERTA
jgi:hypothetical protein